MGGRLWAEDSLPRTCDRVEVVPMLTARCRTGALPLDRGPGHRAIANRHRRTELLDPRQVEFAVALHSEHLHEDRIAILQPKTGCPPAQLIAIGDSQLPCPARLERRISATLQVPPRRWRGAARWLGWRTCRGQRRKSSDCNRAKDAAADRHGKLLQGRRVGPIVIHRPRVGAPPSPRPCGTALLAVLVARRRLRKKCIGFPPWGRRTRAIAGCLPSNFRGNQP